MKNLLFVLLAVGLVWWGLGLMRPSGEDTAGDVEFVRGYEAGMTQAKNEGKPAMLFFTAHW